MTISTYQDLLAALKVAAPGSTLLLAGGAYPTLALVNLAFASSVVVASADPANPAVFAGAEMDRVAGLTLRDLKFGLNARTKTVVNVTNSSRVVLERADVGDVAGSAQPGLMFRNCLDVAARECVFHDLGTAGRGIDSTGVFWEANTFRDIRGDGLQHSGCSRVGIVGNSFSDFYWSEGDHPDAIQFFTFNQTASVSDILISDNRIVRCKGMPVQGIFMGNEKSLPYLGVRLLRNTVIGCMWHGISLYLATDVVAESNHVQALAEADTGSWMMLAKCAGRSTNNRATALRYDDSGAGLVISGDVVIAPLDADTPVEPPPSPPAPDLEALRAENAVMKSAGLDALAASVLLSEARAKRLADIQTRLAAAIKATSVRAMAPLVREALDLASAR